MITAVLVKVSVDQFFQTVGHDPTVDDVINLVGPTSILKTKREQDILKVFNDTSASSLYI